jgi:Fe-S-cluster-containing hydrogenase component 2
MKTAPAGPLFVVVLTGATGGARPCLPTNSRRAAMPNRVPRIGDSVVLFPDRLDDLIQELRRRGYTVVGPTVRDGAIVYDELASAYELPAGWTDRQDAGTYRLERRQDGAVFGHTVGPHSWKRYFHVPVQRLWTVSRNGDGMRLVEEPLDERRYALIGVRACELAAVAIQDRVLTQNEYHDPHYAARRRDTFIVAVNCGQAGGTCFCASMGTGPKVTEGFDLAITELLGDSPSAGHEFVVEVGTDAGADVIAGIEHVPAAPAQIARAEERVDAVREQMGRSMDTSDIHDLLYRNLESPRWEEVAQRCLACTNCTMVCPTCFCTTVEDVTDLAGGRAERMRMWDSCFTLPFSYIVGGSVRKAVAARYRQWLTHKLASWIDQFGTSGCVGCGRCITWCPAGIDITEEVRAIREREPEVARTPG